MFIFRSPLTFRRIPTRSPLWRWAGEYVGQTLLVTGTTVTPEENPTTDQIEASDIAVLGGHQYEIDNDLAAILAAAGYGSGIEAPCGGSLDSYVDSFGDTY